MPDAAQTDGYAEDGKCPPLLHKWQGRIKPALDHHRTRVKEFEKNRLYARGQQNRDSNSGLVTTNLIHANLSTTIPHIYAKNPEIAVSPSKSASPQNYANVKAFAQTMEIVLQRMFVLEGALKSRMRSSLFGVFNTGEAWLKLIYQRDYKDDPLIKSRINDAQDNLARMQRLIESSKDLDSGKETEAMRDELRMMVDAMQEQVEVVVSEGLVIDRILTDDVLILDRTLTDFDAYVQAEALDHMVWLSKEDYEEKFGKLPESGGPNVYHERKLKEDNASQPSAKPGEEVELVCVHEIWHLRTNTVLTFADGAKGWAREPYQPQRMGERWYPFFRMGWNIQDGSCEPIADISLQRDLQDEYNASRTQWKAAREEAKPVRLARGNGSLTEQDINNIKNRKSNDIIVVDGRSDSPLQQDLAQLDAPVVDMAIYDTSPIRGDMELVAGRGDAAAGGVVEAKTATEAEIQQAGLMSRSDYRRDITEDCITEMATCAAQILLQEMTVPQIEFIAGQGATWPAMAKAEVFSLINIEVRAGSTGKPNAAKDREQWTQLMPVIQQTIAQIFELQALGDLRLADIQRKLMKETLRRFDERLDLDEFLGPESEEGQAQQQQMAALQQEVAELRAQLEQAAAQAAEVDTQKMQAEQVAVEDRQHERGLREREFEDRRQERQSTQQRAQGEDRKRAATQAGEAQAKAGITREQWDREDQRSQAQRTHEKGMKGQEELLAKLQQQIDEYAQAKETPDAGDDEAAEGGLREVLAQLAQAMQADATEKRATREAVMAHLAGKKQPPTQPRAQ